MNIDELTDQEKSVKLAKAMGWEITNEPRIDGLQFVHDGKGNQLNVSRDEPFTLYDPANMALAWRVLNWACEIALDDKTGIKPGYTLEDIAGDVVCHSPAAAQRAWLDKILELAIEAGLVEVEHENNR